MFRIPERLYRTADGRLVRHGDPEAAFLAFPEGEQMSEEEAERFGVLAFFGEKNRAEAPRNKQAPRPADKSAVRVEPEHVADPEPEPAVAAEPEPEPAPETPTAAPEPESVAPKPRAKPGPKPGYRRSRT